MIHLQSMDNGGINRSICINGRWDWELGGDEITVEWDARAQVDCPACKELFVFTAVCIGRLEAFTKALTAYQEALAEKQIVEGWLNRKVRSNDEFLITHPDSFQKWREPTLHEEDNGDEEIDGNNGELPLPPFEEIAIQPNQEIVIAQPAVLTREVIEAAAQRAQETGRVLPAINWDNIQLTVTE